MTCKRRKQGQTDTCTAKYAGILPHQPSKNTRGFYLTSLTGLHRQISPNYFIYLGEK